MNTLPAADAAWIHQQARRNPNDPQWDDGRDDAITDRAWDYRTVPAKIRDACANLDDQSFEVELTTLAVNFFLGNVTAETVTAAMHRIGKQLEPAVYEELKNIADADLQAEAEA